MRRFRFQVLLGGLAALALAQPAAAFPHHHRHHHLRACRADIETLCPEARGHAEVSQCLRDNQDRLSPACQTQLQRREACRADVEALCPDARGPEIGECLRDNEESLSEECLAEHERREACREEIDALCPDVQGRFELARCIRRNLSILPDGCRPPAPPAFRD